MRLSLGLRRTLTNSATGGVPLQAIVSASFAATPAAASASASPAATTAAPAAAPPVAPFAVLALRPRRPRQGWRHLAARIRILFAQEHLPRKLDSILIVDRNHFHAQHVADLADFVYPADIAFGEFRNVTESVAPGQDFDERPEILDRCDPPFVNLADLHLLRERLHARPSRLGARRIGVGDEDRAVVVDIELGAGRFLNTLDRLAAGTDQQPDLFRIDLHGNEPWSVPADFAARPQDRLEHRLQDLDPPLARLFERALDDLLADAVDLEVELNAADAVLRARDFEIHIGEMILVAHDVGQQE